MDVLAEVQNVTDRFQGSQLDGAVSAGATTVKVLNPWEFNTDSDGQLIIGTDVYSFTVPEILARVAPQNDSSVPAPSAGEMEPLDDEWDYAGVLNISPPAVTSYATETPVYQYPLVTERWATLREPGGGEDLIVRVAAPMTPYMAKGSRKPGTGEPVIASHRLGALHLTDHLGALPAFDGTFIVNGTVKAQHINVGSLSALSANLGNITAGTMTAVTTQTSVADPKGIFDAAGFRLTEADGTVAFQVAGGNGITFKADTGDSISVARMVRWMQGAAVIGTATSWESGGQDVVLLQAIRRSTNQATALLSASDGGAHTASQLQVHQTGAVGDVKAQAGSANATVIDESNKSSWPKMPLVSDHSINRGVTTVSYGGASPLSGAVTVSHNLPSTPVAVVATAGAGGGLYNADASALGSSTFSMRTRTLDNSNPANGTTVDVYWIAFT